MERIVLHCPVAEWREEEQSCVCGGGGWGIVLVFGAKDKTCLTSFLVVPASSRPP